jgi:hypothetical protein
LIRILALFRFGIAKIGVLIVTPNNLERNMKYFRLNYFLQIDRLILKELIIKNVVSLFLFRIFKNYVSISK